MSRRGLGGLSREGRTLKLEKRHTEARVASRQQRNPNEYGARRLLTMQVLGPRYRSTRGPTRTKSLKTANPEKAIHWVT
jgi:hypothetical protein